MMTTGIIHVAAFLVGGFIVAVTLVSVARTLLVPRNERAGFTSVVFLGMRRIFDASLIFTKTYRGRDRIMAFYAPVSLIVLVVAWLVVVAIGYAFIFWAVGITPWQTAFAVSGSSLLTLGIRNTASFGATNIAFSEATIGLILIALLIAYLPTMYSTFSRREAAVTMLDVRAGTPPSAVELLKRYHHIHGLTRLDELWRTWETWFVDLNETHTSLAALPFFRSPHPQRSWVTASGAIMDAAALARSTLDIPTNMDADLCIRAGFLALRDIGSFFNIPFNAMPDHHDDISITRAEFDAAYDELRDAGLPMRADRDAAWHDFAGWRVNYDIVLVALARLVMAPDAPWCTDRRFERGRVVTPARTDADPYHDDAAVSVAATEET